VNTVELASVRKSYDDFVAVDDLSLRIQPGRIYGLLGPNGAGKTSTLRMIIGIIVPDSGQVLMLGEPLSRAHTNRLGYLPEERGLYKRMKVLTHLVLLAQLKGLTSGEAATRAHRWCERLELTAWMDKKVEELSKGMQQKVQFIGAILHDPELVVMDEPFSALDVLTAETLRGELLELWLGHKIPTRAIFIVTHNIEEAVVLADRIIVLGRNPAHIHADFTVTIPYPRDRKTPEFISLVDDIYRVLTRPDEHQLITATSGSQPGKPVGHKPIMLPHTRPGGMAGLLEILVDLGGRIDLHRLADELSLEVDALLPTVDTAALLGLLRVEEGDAIITPEGQEFARADIQTRKAIFRKTALANVPLLRQMEQSLKAKADRTLSDEFFRDLLDEHFSEDEARRQLETAIQWGRYAELFDYDAATGKLTLTEV